MLNLASTLLIASIIAFPIVTAAPAPAPQAEQKFCWGHNNKPCTQNSDCWEGGFEGDTCNAPQPLPAFAMTPQNPGQCPDFSLCSATSPCPDGSACPLPQFGQSHPAAQGLCANRDSCQKPGDCKDGSACVFSPVGGFFMPSVEDREELVSNVCSLSFPLQQPPGGVSPSPASPSLPSLLTRLHFSSFLPATRLTRSNIVFRS